MLPFRSPINDVLYTSISDVYTLQLFIFETACHGQIVPDEIVYDKDQDTRLEQRAPRPQGNALSQAHYFRLTSQLHDLTLTF